VSFIIIFGTPFPIVDSTRPLFGCTTNFHFVSAVDDHRYQRGVTDSQPQTAEASKLTVLFALFIVVYSHKNKKNTQEAEVAF